MLLEFRYLVKLNMESEELTMEMEFVHQGEKYFCFTDNAPKVLKNKMILIKGFFNQFLKYINS